MSQWTGVAGACPWGAAPGALWAFPGNSRAAPVSTKPDDYVQHTQSPSNSGSSVVAVRYNSGVVMAADTLASYGSLARFKDCQRLLKLNDCIAVGASGDYADFQYMKQIMERNITDEACLDDGIQMKPRALYSWLTRVMYNRRCKMDFIWNTFVVAGMQDNVPFLGAIDKLGTAYEDVCIGTGFASYLAVPLIREYTDKKTELTEKDAKELIDKCMNTLYYRDARSFYKYQVAIIDEKGVRIIDDKQVAQNWDHAHMIKGY